MRGTFLLTESVLLRARFRCRPATADQTRARPNSHGTRCRGQSLPDLPSSLAAADMVAPRKRKRDVARARHYPGVGALGALLAYWAERGTHRSLLRRRGQSVVEFALILPVILVIVMVGLDFGRAFFAWVTVTNASRAGAAYAASNPDAGWATSPDSSTAAVYRSQITTDVLPVNCDLPTPLPLPSFLDTTNTYALGSRVQVVLTCVFHPLTPIIGNLIGFNIPITASTVYPIRAGQIAGGPVLNVLPSASPSASPSPSPSPSPSSSAGASPSPSPAQCQVPALTGHTVSQAASLWTGAGFTGAISVFYAGSSNADTVSKHPTWNVTQQDPLGNLPTEFACTSPLSLWASN
jgi:hypothetical protein